MSLLDVVLFYLSCQVSAVVGLQLLQPAGSLKAGAWTWIVLVNC